KEPFGRPISLIPQKALKLCRLKQDAWAAATRPMLARGSIPVMQGMDISMTMRCGVRERLFLRLSKPSTAWSSTRRIDQFQSLESFEQLTNVVEREPRVQSPEIV